ncbi:hypothetical protein I317_06111 [Kwoniella heveanensis CBS 569]|uniref:GATA-type domain-containing protein n=1 Tax=Kwoniella heveanensis BCC8398 TaxID=1296120 RepID=A0A1B9GYG2_9TREE|nr:hypothetical protein I316_01949 [Kwoniella heveanensis BCC8398]OCF40098.1 hypothetical protein I317_06111 [Kwoniella heveanensis CBS 569]
MWRSNPVAQILPALDNVLCNACGLYYLTHGKARPPQYWRGRRRRSSGSPSGSDAGSDSGASTAESDLLRTPTSPDPRVLARSPSPPPRKNRWKTRGQKANQEEREMAIAAEILLGMRRENDHAGPKIPCKKSSPLLSSAHAQSRPAWIFNRPFKVVPVPPPGGFHHPPAHKSVFNSIHGCCPGHSQHKAF